MKTLTKKEQRAIVRGIMENATVELKSYMEVADNYINSNLHVPEINHVGIIIDKMTEHIDKLNKLFLNDELEIFEI